MMLTMALMPQRLERLPGRGDMNGDPRVSIEDVIHGRRPALAAPERRLRL